MVLAANSSMMALHLLGLLLLALAYGNPVDGSSLICSENCPFDRIGFLKSSDGYELFVDQKRAEDVGMICELLGLYFKECISCNNHDEEWQWISEKYCNLEKRLKATKFEGNLLKRPGRKLLLQLTNSSAISNVLNKRNQTKENEQENSPSMESDQIVLAIPGMFLLCLSLICPCFRSKKDTSEDPVLARDGNAKIINMTTESSQVPSVSGSVSSQNFVPSGSSDPGWKYGYIADRKDTNSVTCNFCGKVSKGGISRFKRHIAGIKGNVASCKKATEEAKADIKAHLDEFEKKKEEKKKVQEEALAEVNIFGEKEDEEVLSVGSKRPRSKGPMDRFTTVEPEIAISQRGKTVQSSIKNAFAKEERDKVNDYLAGWVYKCGIPFNAMIDKSFHLFCEAVGQYGPGYKPATMHEYREPLLKKQVIKTNEALQNHREAWKNTGCSLLTDAWTDRKGRSIMNLCVSCELGVSFLRSVDASTDAHTCEYIHNIVVEGIKEVGEDNVLQVVTDNAAANLAAARLLKNTYPKIYWTSCAAHTIDLMLEKISKEGRIKGSIERGREVTVFIYGHHRTLSMMRQFTQKREIVRPGVTRFATSFLTLQSLLEKKEKLRLMFTSDEFMTCKWSKTAKGKKAYLTILSNQFWRQVSLAVQVFHPLVKLLRVVDGERKRSMGFIYGGLKDAKKDIKKFFNDNETAYKPFIEAIDHYMDGKLDTHIHTAAYYLNPYYFYRDLAEIEKDGKVMDGIFSCIENFYPDPNTQTHITGVEMRAYKTASGMFGRQHARRYREVNDDEFSPVHSFELRSSSERMTGTPLRVPASPSRFSLSPQPSEIGPLQLTISQIVKMTHNFSPGLVIGEGVFRTVYKAELPDGGQVVAIKRTKKEHLAALRDEFSNEVALLTKIEHRNLVQLLGYVNTRNESIIITEYVPNGNLRDHLDGQRGKILDFSQRLEIAIDVAHGLTYLHLYAEKPIIHRDVKSSNILLTESFRAKVADFGFARTGPMEGDQTHIETNIKGTAGYLDPEYLRTYHLTIKSDVFSFGILLIEILSARRPVELKRHPDEKITIRWAFAKYNEDQMRDILDPMLQEVVHEDVLNKILSLAFQCAAPTRSDRPVMKEVVERLWGIRKDYVRSRRRS